MEAPKSTEASTVKVANCQRSVITDAVGAPALQSLLSNDLPCIDVPYSPATNLNNINIPIGQVVDTTSKPAVSPNHSKIDGQRSMDTSKLLAGSTFS